MTDKFINSERAQDGDDNFYEAMPGVMNDYYYRQMGDPDQADAAEHDDLGGVEAMTQQAKLTAIVTIILAGVVALGLAVLFFRGLDVIKNISPKTVSSQNQSY